MMIRRSWTTLLALALLGLNGVHMLSLSKADQQNAADQKSSMVADMLDIAQAAEIKEACPMKDTYCIPRVRCLVKSVVYDREGIRFIMGSEFKDLFGCGAFNPTWTYVCCSSRERIVDVAPDWSPTRESWFLPATDGTAPKNVDPPVPVLAPWPNFGVDQKNDSAVRNVSPISSGDKAILREQKAESASTERPQPSERNVQSTDPNLLNIPPFLLNPVQQIALNDPRNAQFFANNFPINPMMNQPPWMIPQNFMPPDPRLILQQQQQNQLIQQQLMQQQQQQRVSQSQPPPPPPPEWVEMIIFYADGTSQHTFRDTRRLPLAGTVDASANPMADPQRRPVSPPNAAPPQKDAQQSASTSNTEPSTTPSSTSSTGNRSRRATEKFKLPMAKGGIWTGNQSQSSDDDAQGRSALLPKPNAQWGAPLGSAGPVRFVPIPPSFGVNGERCGMTSGMGINARILTGRKPGSQIEGETNFGQFPWHCAVVNGQTGEYLCACTIISARFVLTVAHCVRKYQLTLLFVRVGDWDLSGTAEMLPSYDVEVTNVQVHEDYYAGNMQNDIALLQLKFPMDFGVMPHVGTLCLPPSSEPIYHDCVVTGWGQQLATSEAKGDTSTFSRTLKQATQTLVTAQSCEKSLRPFLGQFYQLPKKGFVCAYDKDGKDSCFGDGGGALACLVNAPNYPRGNQYHVVGLVSWGVGCGMPNVPSVYTAVWDYLDWINAKVSPLDPYSPTGNGELLGKQEPTVPIMVRSNEAGATVTVPTTTTTTPPPPPPPTKPLDFIDLAFRN